jgi:hypothetical protein
MQNMLVRALTESLVAYRDRMKVVPHSPESQRAALQLSQVKPLKPGKMTAS